MHWAQKQLSKTKCTFLLNSNLTLKQTNIQNVSYRHTFTWQVLRQILPLMWQTDILNHLVYLNCHLGAAASFQPGVEVDMLLHCHTVKVKMIPQWPFDWHVRGNELQKRPSHATNSYASVWNSKNVTFMHFARWSCSIRFALLWSDVKKNPKFHHNGLHYMSISMFAWIF